MRILAAFLLLSLAGPAAEPQPWRIPLGGNAHFVEGRPERVAGEGVRWADPAARLATWFHVDRPGELQLALRLRVPEGRSTLKAGVADKVVEVAVEGAEFHVVPLGGIRAQAAGYLRVDLAGIARTGPCFAEISDLLVTAETPGMKASYVRHDEGGMFYWGRRGPSVHLGYELPPGRDIEYAYSELTVPAGGDPIGSFFMANGFGQGYFGLQVKSPTERWVLFSVWSPHATDRPAEIPEGSRVVLLRKGAGVRVGEFGGEGSGGQSVLVYPWKAETTYRFLTAVQPDGRGSTIYRAWFGEVGRDGWQLIASFRRPKTDTLLTGFHSFLENFDERNGHLGRRARHGNPWVRDRAGVWHEITRARFTGDATARGGHRLDYAGGVAGKAFFLRNGGFFDERVPLDRTFTRPATPERKPEIDFEALDGR
jgi:hypothetical protein